MLRYSRASPEPSGSGVEQVTRFGPLTLEQVGVPHQAEAIA
jgi:hypothetical protein